jgi:hypothetical protein
MKGWLQFSQYSTYFRKIEAHRNKDHVAAQRNTHNTYFAGHAPLAGRADSDVRQDEQERREAHADRQHKASTALQGFIVFIPSHPSSQPSRSLYKKTQPRTGQLIESR